MKQKENHYCSRVRSCVKIISLCFWMCGGEPAVTCASDRRAARFSSHFLTGASALYRPTRVPGRVTAVSSIKHVSRTPAPVLREEAARLGLMAPCAATYCRAAGGTPPASCPVTRRGLRLVKLGIRWLKCWMFADSDVSRKLLPARRLARDRQRRWIHV